MNAATAEPARRCPFCGGPERCPNHAVAPWYRPHAKQVPLHCTAGAKIRNVCAGRRGGKTIACAVEFTAQIYRDWEAGLARPLTEPDLPIWDRSPRLHYWIVAPQMSLAIPAYRYMWRTLPKGQRNRIRPDSKIAGFRRAPWFQWWLPGDILIEVKSGEHPEALVGVGLDGAWLTEAARLKPEVWSDNLLPALADRGGWLLTDTTPLGQNWYYTELWRRPGARNFHWHSVDNPYADGLATAVADARRLLRPDQFRREFEASFDAYSGTIYSLDRSIHVFTGPVHRDQYGDAIGGFDWGRAHAGCLLILGVRRDGGLDVVHEEYHAGRLASHWIDTVRRTVELWRPSAIYSDPSSPILPDMEDAGLPVQPAVERHVVAGIERVASQLAARSLRIHERCPSLISEMGAYRWRETETGHGDQPIKERDDACDALRYAVASHARGDPFVAL